MYSLLNTTRVVKSRMRWAGHVAQMGERGVHRVLVGKPEGKRPLGRPRHSWEDIKMNLQEVGVMGIGWSWLRIGTGGRHLSTVINLRVPKMRGI